MIKHDIDTKDELKRKKILEKADKLKADFKQTQRDLIEIARKLALLRWAYLDEFSEKEVVSIRSEPAVFLKVQVVEDSPLFEIYPNGKFHLEIYRAFEMQKQGHIRILPDDEQEESITKIEDVPEQRIYREYKFKSLPEPLDELKHISFNQLYKPNGEDDKFLFNRELSINLLEPRGSQKEIEKNLEKVLEGR